MNFDQIDSSCTGFLPSPPDSPSMSRSRPNPEEVGRDHLRPTTSSSHNPFRQTCDGINDLVNTLSHQSEHLQTRICQGRSSDLTADSLRRFAASSLASAPEGGQSTRILSPVSAAGLSPGDEKSTGDPTFENIDFRSQLTQNHNSTEHPSPSDEEDGASSIESDGGDDIGAEKTGAERLAEKRKMKRFRSASSAMRCSIRLTKMMNVD